MATPTPPSIPTPPPLSPLQARLLTRFPTLSRLHLLAPSIPLPRLLASFLILHELTAVLSLVGTFYALRSVDGGRAVIAGLTNIEPGGQGFVKGWVEEGEERVAKVGKRYGILGYEKRKKGEEVELEILGPTPGVVGVSTSEVEGLATMDQGAIAGNVANAVGAFIVTKALMPARIAASFYLSPPFARAFIMPIARGLTRLGLRK